MAFDLLQDFWCVLPKLDIEDFDIERIDRDYVDNEIREPLTMSLRAVEDTVARYDYTWVRHKAKSALRDDEFCITLDHGVYFCDADFQLDVSRTASDLRHTGRQHLTRQPRELLDLPTQLAELSSNLATSRKKRVVIADDGLDTGQTLSMVIARCRDYGIEVRRAIVCCNNTELSQISDSVKIAAIIKRSPGRPWLNERDLYWGLPRSGLTLAPLARSGRSYSVPFSFTSRLVLQRIGVEDITNEFRTACLRANRALWALFEQQVGRQLYCEDSPPLRFFADILGLRGTRVIDILTDLINGSEIIDLLGEAIVGT